MVRKFIFILLTLSILTFSNSKSAVIPIYLNFKYPNEQFFIKEISFNQINLKVDKSFRATKIQKQFLITVANHPKLDNTNISTITINGKVYYLDRPISLKEKQDIKGIFINHSPNSISVSSQHILSSEKKLFVTLPQYNAISVIDEDKQKIIGFIPTQDTPSGIGIVNDKVFCGMKNDGIVKVFCALSGFHIKTLTIPGCSGVKEIKKLQNKILILDKTGNSIFIYDTGTETTKMVPFLNKIISFSPLKDTNTVAVSLNRNYNNIVLISISNGKIVRKFTTSNFLYSIDGDKENLFGIEPRLNSIAKYNILTQQEETQTVNSFPIYLKEIEKTLALSTKEKLIFFDSQSLFPFKNLPIKNITYMKPDNNRRYLYTFHNKTVNIIDLNSLSNISKLELISKSYSADTN